MRYRRKYRRHSSPRRRTSWMYASNFNVAPAGAGLGLNTEDLLAPYRVNAGITLNLPKMTIGRIVIKISVRIDIGAAPTTSQDGFIVGFHVDPLAFAVNPLSQTYHTSWMWREVVYAGEEQANTIVSGAVTDVLVVKTLDIRSRRRIMGDNDTLTLEISPLPGSTLIDYSYDAQILAFV